MHPVPESDWFKSSYSQGEAACVEVAHLPTIPSRKLSHSASSAAGAAIRDSKHRELGSLVFPHSEWPAFLDAVKERGF